MHYEQFQDGTVKCIEDEIPFDVPDGWAWTRLEKITTIITDYVANGSFASLKANVKTYKEKNYAIFVRTIDFANGFKKDLSYIDKDSYEFLEKSKLFGGELMLSNIGASIGKVFKIPHLTVPMSLAPNSIILRFTDSTISDFLEFVFKSFVGQDYLEYLSGGAAMPKFNKTDLRIMLVAIPPLKEQIKIITKIKNASKIIDTIEEECIDFNELVNIIKSKILDLAIRGKLVPQDPNDEPASLLLERIKAEKEELIKQGKIKRDKKESVIFKGEDNSYYQDLPENWKKTTLRKITTPLTLNDGDWILTENMNANGEVKLLQLGSIGNMMYIDKGFKFLTKQTFDELSCTAIFPNYLIINRIISDKMCCCIIPNIEGTIITTVDTCWIAPCPQLYNLKFLMYQLASPAFQSMVLMKATGTTRKRISKNNLLDLPLLFPPLVEQKRIAQAIETAFEQLDEITNSIS